MKYLSVLDTSKKWGISERSVRDYCSKGRVIGAILIGKTWNIPDSAEKPTRLPRHSSKINNLLQVLKEEKENKINGGIYHKIQIEMTYNSNQIEGSQLSHDQTSAIFETKTLLANEKVINVDDVIETTNHFRCVDLVIDSAKSRLTESLIKQLHYILKVNTNNSNQKFIRIGDYKLLENEVGGRSTARVCDVQKEMKKLLEWYHSLDEVRIEDIIEFHYRFESIHPFQDGNGRVGRLIMFKECLKHNYVPIIIKDEFKAFYYRGLKEWNNDSKYLIDTCLLGQDIMKEILDNFSIKY